MRHRSHDSLSRGRSVERALLVCGDGRDGRLTTDPALGKRTELDSNVPHLKLLSSPHIRPQPSCKLSDHANTWRLPLGARPASQESKIPMVSPTFIIGIETSRQSAFGRLRLHLAGSGGIRRSGGCSRGYRDWRLTQHPPGRLCSRPRSLALPLGACRQSSAGDTWLCSAALQDGQVCDGGSVAAGASHSK